MSSAQQRRRLRLAETHPPENVREHVFQRRRLAVILVVRAPVSSRQVAVRRHRLLRLLAVPPARRELYHGPVRRFHEDVASQHPHVRDAHLQHVLSHWQRQYFFTQQTSSDVQSGVVGVVFLGRETHGAAVGAARLRARVISPRGVPR